MTVSNCHPDCGVIVSDLGYEHAHENLDGICWHDEPVEAIEDCPACHDPFNNPNCNGIVMPEDCCE